MSLKDFCLIFPSVFMVHELEEILLMPKFISKLFNINRGNRLLSYYSPFRFNLIVFAQLLLLLFVLVVSCIGNNFLFYMTIIIAYVYHIIGHLIQSLIVRKYVPGLFSGVVTALFCIVSIQEFLGNNLQLYFYSIITLFLIFLNIGVSFKLLTKILKL